MFDLLQKTFLVSPLVLCQSEQAHRSECCNWWLSVAIIFSMMAFLAAFTVGAALG